MRKNNIWERLPIGYSKDVLFYLLVVSFFFTTAFSLRVSAKPQGVSEVLSFSSETVVKKVYPDVPVFRGGGYPVLSAQAVLAIDLDSMSPLYEKNPDNKLLPASTTKIATALVALDYYRKDQILTVQKSFVDGQKMGLIKGERIKAIDLIYGLLIHSANDAAETLADNYPGGRDAFINSMNVLARKYHLDNTNFENPTGFDGPNHYSTARDLIRIAQIAMENPVFAKAVSIKGINVVSEDGKLKHNLDNTNELLGEVEGVRGIKTGWTQNARENLVTYLEKDSKKIIIALLGSQDRFGETEEVINFIFNSYAWEKVGY